MMVGLVLTGGSAPALAEVRDDFTKLELAMSEANLAYYTALEKSGDESNIKDAKSRPVDGRLPLLKKMDALAASSLGSPAATYINFETFTWSVDVEPDKLLSRFSRLVKHFPDDDALGEVVTFLPDMLADATPVAGWPDVLDHLAETTKSKDIKLAALLAQGRVLAMLNKPDKAKKTLQKLLALKPDDELAKAAKGFIFEMEHLQIGMVAPDFTTKTLDGKKVSLSSFRGKFVLLKFWASW